MEEFVHRRNVVHYTRLLRASPNPSHRSMLMKLLAEETAKAHTAGWMPMLG